MLNYFLIITSLALKIALEYSYWSIEAICTKSKKKKEEEEEERKKRSRQKGKQSRSCPSAESCSIVQHMTSLDCQCCVASTWIALCRNLLWPSSFKLVILINPLASTKGWWDEIYGECCDWYCSFNTNFHPFPRPVANICFFYRIII